LLSIGFHRHVLDFRSRASAANEPEETTVRTFIVLMCVVTGFATAQADPPAGPNGTGGASDSLPEIHRVPAYSATNADTVRDARSLAATTAPLWNPPQATPSRRRWERIVDEPGHLLSLPLAGLGRLTRSGLTYFEESSLMPAGFNPAPHQRHRVISVGSPDLYGFGAALQLYRPVFADRLQTDLIARFAATIDGYNATELAISGKPLTLSYGNEWRSQERFYGIGNDTPKASESDYALKSVHVGARLEHAWQGPRTPGAPDGTRVAVWGESHTDATLSGRGTRVPSYVVTTPEVAATSLGRRVDHTVYGASLSMDERAGLPHWYHGNRVLVSAERHDDPIDGLTLHPDPVAGSRFTRYEGVAETGLSFYDRDPRTLRLMARVVDERPDPGSPPLLPSEFATLGDREGLAGFDRGRFRDLGLLYGRVSYILPVSRRLELEGHSEWGSVYHDVWTDARLAGLHHSFGVSLRGRYELGLLASAGVDFSREGFRVSYSLGSTR
jgi:hypothetical protein